MGSDKTDVKQAVENRVVEATAIQISPQVAESHQKRINDEMQAAHLQNMGMMAIQNAIDEDKSEYEAQLDQIREAMEKAEKALSEAENRKNKTIQQFKNQLVCTELRKKAVAAVRALNKIPNLSNKFKDAADDQITVRVLEPDPDGDTPQVRAGYVAWVFEANTEEERYHHKSVKFSGTRNLSKKCMDALKAVASAEADVKELSNLNREVRLRIQGLERERRDLERKLRKEIVSKSMVGQQVEDMLKNSRKKVKVLPLPAKFRK